jgi:hypothetical protein
MANPLHEDAIESIENACGSKIEIFVSTGSEIERALKEYYGIQIKRQEPSQILAQKNMHEEK